MRGRDRAARRAAPAEPPLWRADPASLVGRRQATDPGGPGSTRTDWMISTARSPTDHPANSSLTSAKSSIFWSWVRATAGRSVACSRAAHRTISRAARTARCSCTREAPERGARRPRACDRARSGRAPSAMPRPQLLLDVGAVGLDRPHRQIQLLGDLGVRVSEGDHPQHLDLALGQPVGRAGRRLGGDARAEARVQVGVARGGAANRLDQLGLGGLLEHVAERARARARGARRPARPAS